LINARNLFYPLLSFQMGDFKNFFSGPMKMVSNKSYLLGELFQGVANYPSEPSSP
jgi:hypothetical protein